LPTPYSPAMVPPPPPLPLYFEDEGLEMGESNIHLLTNEILHVCVQALLSEAPDVQVFSNLNLIYTDPRLPDTYPAPYVSPDLMIVRPTTSLPVLTASYHVGRDGPAPVLTADTLSERSWEELDLSGKLDIYAMLGVREYVTIDVTGRFLPQRLILRLLREDRSWSETQDADGGVTSELGFRLVVESDGHLRVIDQKTGQRQPRPHEARRLAHAQQAAEQRANDLEARLRELEAELARLRQSPPTR